MKNNKPVIGIIAPSYPITYLSKQRISFGYDYLIKNGFEIKEHPQCRIKNQYMAGTISQRVDSIHDFLRDPEVDIIMSFWGGYNSNQLLDFIDYDLIKSSKKKFIGYSDVSFLLNAITKITGQITYLGPGAITFTKPDIFIDNILWLKKCMLDITSEYELSQPDFFAADSFQNRDDNKRIVQKNNGWLVINEGVVKNKKIVATNLTVLESMIQTKYMPEMRDSVLFAEISESETLPIFDRLMTHLNQAGILNELSGFIFSKTMEDSKIYNEDIVRIISENIKKDIPIIYNFDCGHTDPVLTIPNGGQVTISAVNSEIKILISK